MDWPFGCWPHIEVSFFRDLNYLTFHTSQGFSSVSMSWYVLAENTYVYHQDHFPYSFDVGLHTRCVSGACHHGERERGRRRWMMQWPFLHGDLLIVWILMSQLPGVAWIVQDNQSDCNGIVLQRCGAWIQEGNILMLQGWSKEIMPPLHLV